MKKKGNVESVGIYPRFSVSFMDCLVIPFCGTHLCFLVFSAPQVLVVCVVAKLYSPLMLGTLIHLRSLY